jgi:hypothetical protein
LPGHGHHQDVDGAFGHFKSFLRTLDCWTFAQLVDAVLQSFASSHGGRTPRFVAITSVLRLRELLDTFCNRTFPGIADALSFVVLRDADGMPRYVVRRTSAIAIQQQPPHEHHMWHPRLPVHPPLAPGLAIRVRDLKHGLSEVHLPPGTPLLSTLPLLTRVGGADGLDEEGMRRVCFADEVPRGFGTLLFTSSPSLLSRSRLLHQLGGSLCAAGPLQDKYVRTLRAAADSPSLTEEQHEQLMRVVRLRSLAELLSLPTVASLST